MLNNSVSSPQSSDCSLSRLNLISTIQNNNKEELYSLCFLRDGRLVSSGNKRIVIYSKHFLETDIIINSNFSVSSVCALRNGNLAFSNILYDIKIYEIDGKTYNEIHTLKVDFYNQINRIIELEDGRLCSCSCSLELNCLFVKYDRVIRIFDNNNYQIIRTLKSPKSFPLSIIEMNDFIISINDNSKKCLEIWDKQTYEYIVSIDDIYCSNGNSLAKLKEGTIIIGGNGVLFIFDISSFEYKSFKNKTLGKINSILVLKEDQVLLGNNIGQIICYDSLSNQITFAQRVHSFYSISCIVKGEDNQIVSSSLYGSSINTYDY